MKIETHCACSRSPCLTLPIFLHQHARLWPHSTVPYKFDDEIKGNSGYKGNILTAMKEWEEKTCVKFEPYSDQLALQLGHKQRIRLVTDWGSCWSSLGMIKRPIPQKVSSGCIGFILIVRSNKACTTLVQIAPLSTQRSHRVVKNRQINK